MYVCMYMYIRMYVCMYVCMYACMYVCMCVYVCMYAGIQSTGHLPVPGLWMKTNFSCEILNAPLPGNRWQSGVRSCIIPGLPTHLVKELPVGTVCMASNKLAWIWRKRRDTYIGRWSQAEKASGRFLVLPIPVSILKVYNE